MAIDFEELEGSPTIRISESGTLATRVFRVAWDDWIDFARSLVGEYAIVGCTFQFLPPIAFPDMPNLVVSDIDVEPFDPGNPEGSEVSTLSSGTNRYPDAGAKVTVRYQNLFDSDNTPRADLPGVPEGTYLTYEADLSAETISTPGRAWQWDDGSDEPLPPDVRPRIMVPTGAFRLVWHRVMLPPWDAIRSLRGHVNATNFVGATPETVMFCGARIRREFQFLTTGGYWRVEYQFNERTVPLASGVGGWNHALQDENGGWVKVKDRAGDPPHPTGDLALLFLFGTC
ncbi:MAG: hypothetical protein MI757_19550 [Pirellulales bacterium]|nr:hypothetical protein [Pirellulales bacterium]